MYLLWRNDPCLGWKTAVFVGKEESKAIVKCVQFKDCDAEYTAKEKENIR